MELFGFGGTEQTAAWDLTDNLLILYVLMVVILKTPIGKMGNIIFWWVIVAVHVFFNCMAVEQTSWFVSLYMTGCFVYLITGHFIRWDLSRKHKKASEVLQDHKRTG